MVHQRNVKVILAVNQVLADSDLVLNVLMATAVKTAGSFLEEPSVGRVTMSVTFQSTATARPSSASRTSPFRTVTRATTRKPTVTMAFASTTMHSARISLAQKPKQPPTFVLLK